MKPRLARLLLGCSLLGWVGASAGLAEEKKEPPARIGIGAKATLDPTVRRSLGNKATVLVFLGVGCPVSNAYVPHLNELAKKYDRQGVRFIGINANAQDSAADVARHAKEFAITFPVLKDDGQRIAGALGAERVPEAVVLDAQATIRYRGRIDDRYGVTSRKDKPAREDLAIALDEVLAGKPVQVAQTPVSGCIIGRDSRPSSQPISYTNQVARILQKKCQSCHREEGVAPFTLADYDQVKAWSRTIKEVVVQRRMPPWHADPHYGKFANDRSLTQAEIDTLVAWVDKGSARGDDKDLPPPVEFPKGGWTIGKPDVVIEIPKEFVVPATGTLPYQDFVVETSFPEERWIERAQILPGCKAVHHAGVFVQGGGHADALCVYVPGDSPLVLPPGTAKRIPAGAKLRFNLHYTPIGKVVHDRTALGLIFAKKPPEREVKLLTLGKNDIVIPPGEANHREEKEFAIPHDALMLSFFPHMHVRGKSWECRVIYPDGKTETVLKVPRYDFNWQHTYRFAEPLRLPAGSKLHCVAYYDNSKDNPANPDPTKTVKFGPQTWDEMMVAAVEYQVERGSAPPPRIVAASGQERLPSELTLRAAQVLAAQAAKLGELPLQTQLDVPKAWGAKAGQRAVILIPDRRLTEAALLRAGAEVTPIGQLWLKDWTVAVADKASALEKQRLVSFTVGGQNHLLALCLLGVRKNAAGTLELVMYAKESAPLLTLPLQPGEVKQELPIELAAKKNEKGKDALTLHVLGKYQAVLPLAPQGP